ncbi:MAG: hypothetical protein GF309_15060 [Candidatus Lokiarchaeota archaeon]|jgi:hypothetical protein|nr:hypothetical protein [Candidatus Lokiarchaeota archaeon]
MAQVKKNLKHEFWLFHDAEVAEILELRKFIPPQVDTEALEGIDELFDKLNHLLE